MTWYWLAIPIGFLIDLAIGDPEKIPHPVVFIGKLISFLYKKIGHADNAASEKLAGGLIWIIVVTVSTLIPLAILLICGKISFWLRLAVESLMCWQILATKGLRDAAMKVYYALKNGTIDDARKAVSMIVGRDVSALDEAGITRAAVETIAENSSDGIIAPLLFLAIGGAPLGFFYKAVNTMDSMLGYTDPPYTNIGFVPAKMDDLANFWPSRISGLLMLLAGRIIGMDYENGRKIFKRDRYNHASPNSAQTESACAGLLGVRLAGDAYYHGVLHKKKYIGDALREIEIEDIPRAGKLLYVMCVLGLLLAVIIAVAKALLLTI